MQGNMNKFQTLRWMRLFLVDKVHIMNQVSAEAILVSAHDAGSNNLIPLTDTSEVVAASESQPNMVDTNNQELH
jgi:hypothetical protein